MYTSSLLDLVTSLTWIWAYACAWALLEDMGAKNRHDCALPFPTASSVYSRRNAHSVVLSTKSPIMKGTFEPVDCRHHSIDRSQIVMCY